MPLEFSLPFLAVCGAGLTALTYRFWPRIAVRTHVEKHGGIGVREVAFSLGSPAWRAKRAGQSLPKSFEFVIYLTLRSCNQ